MTTTNLTEDDEKWLVALENRMKRLENQMRQRAATAGKPAPVPALAPAPTPSSATAAQDAPIMELLRDKARKHLRTFSFDGAVSRIISGNCDDEILKIFCAPPLPGK